jgi:enoyl-CoA hydratase/carnithine racemase
MTYSKISLAFQSEAAVITIDNPPANALHPQVSDEILDALASIEGHAEVRGVVITGRGAYFVAGGDIAYFTELNSRTAEIYALRIQAMQAAIQDYPLPVIAAVNGYALGGGCELMMACDIRVADETASFGQPEVKLGLIPGAGGTQNLPRLVPLGQAKRMLFTGQRISAAQALQIGLVDEVVSPGAALQAALGIVREIAQCAPLAVSQAKRAVNLGMRMSAADAHRLEAALFADLFKTADVSEGIRAFAEKRPPRFHGR